MLLKTKSHNSLFEVGINRHYDEDWVNALFFDFSVSSAIFRSPRERVVNGKKAKCGKGIFQSVTARPRQFGSIHFSQRLSGAGASICYWRDKDSGWYGHDYPRQRPPR
jgi:hypothetical protein